MTIIASLPYTLTNGTTADATQVMADFNQIRNNVNANAAENGINNSITQLTGLTTPLSVAQGGTGSSSLTANTVLVGSGSSIASVGPGTLGQVLGSKGAGVNPAFVDIYPIGSLYFNASSSTNPATLLGFGTWVAFAQGRIPIGVGTGTDINSNTLTVTAGATGGEYTHTLTTPEIPSHNHTLTDPGHQHGLTNFHGNSAGAGPYSQQAALSGPNASVPTDSATTGITIAAAGGGGAHNNVQPYIGVYIWQRTA